MTTVCERREFRRLKASLEQCMAGGSRTVVVEGAAGSGKSALLDAITEHASRSGAIALRASVMRHDAPPLGVLRQLATPPLPAALHRRLHGALDAPGPAGNEAMQEFCLALHDMAARSPVVVGVDDVHRADQASLEFLQRLAERSRSSRVLLVLTESPYATWADPSFGTDLLRRPNVERIRLGLLSRQGVSDTVADEADLPSDRRFAERCRVVTGGNPVLLQALLQDCRVSANEIHDAEMAQPVVGEAFARAVLACVRRDGPPVSEVADGLAIVGTVASPELLGRLLGLTPASVNLGLRALNAAGIADGCRFRHPAARSAVLDGMAPDDRAERHLQAAILLHTDGVPAATVAEHLRAAGRVGIGGADDSGGAAWQVAVLQDAAEAALADDLAKLAMSYLTMARDACTDEQRRLEITMRLASVARRVNPYAAEQHLDAPLRALRSGTLPVPQFGLLAKLLAAQGRVDEANEVLDRLDELMADRGSPAEAESQVTTLWAAVPHPPLASVSHLGSRRRRSMSPAVAAVARDGRQGALAAAEELLSVEILTDGTLDLVVNAVKTLLCGGRTDRALQWCTELLDESVARKAPGWQAVFSWIWAEVALRQGRPADAEAHALGALDLVPEKNGCLFVGAPTSTLVLACLALGKHEVAGRRLNEPVTGRLFKSKPGLNYRRARGRYYLATNRLQAALGDFLAVGQIAEGWGYDHPLIVPWRTDAAETLLRLGDAERAGRLADEQLALSEDGDCWVQGVSLRFKALASPPSRRADLLGQAVEELRKSGDRLELARALTDLGEAYRSRGEFARATATRRRAWRLAGECGAAPLQAQLGFDRGRLRSDVLPVDADPDDGNQLSDSERRVAALAAAGDTNRAIARKLYVTVSTVEQHLTRVYRKLGIGGRQELPSDLQFEATAPPEAPHPYRDSRSRPATVGP